MTTLTGYVQSHQVYTPLLPPRQSHYEAFPECWLDTIEAIVNFRSEPILKEFLIPDEPRFIAEGLFLATLEKIIFEGPQGAGNRLPGNEFWTKERPLSRKLLHFVANGEEPQVTDGLYAELAVAIGAVRYVRCAPLEEIHQTDPPFEGVHELWWPTQRAFKEGVEQSPQAFAHIIGSNAAAVTALVQAERLL